MNYYVAGVEFSSENSLTHHGIKGQKWGIRRYQNSDGSLTEEGKKRYSKELERFSKDLSNAMKLVDEVNSHYSEKEKIKHRDDYRDELNQAIEGASNILAKNRTVRKMSKMLDKDYSDFFVEEQSIARKNMKNHLQSERKWTEYLKTQYKANGNKKVDIDEAFKEFSKNNKPHKGEHIDSSSILNKSYSAGSAFYKSMYGKPINEIDTTRSKIVEQAFNKSSSLRASESLRVQEARGRTHDMGNMNFELMDGLRRRNRKYTGA